MCTHKWWCNARGRASSREGLVCRRGVPRLCVQFSSRARPFSSWEPQLSIIITMVTDSTSQVNDHRVRRRIRSRYSHLLSLSLFLFPSLPPLAPSFSPSHEMTDRRKREYISSPKINREIRDDFFRAMMSLPRPVEGGGCDFRWCVGVLNIFNREQLRYTFLSS